MVMPTMPNRLPRSEVVGWDRPLSAWMKKTDATRYSNVTMFMLIWRLLQQPVRLFSLFCGTSPACGG